MSKRLTFYSDGIRLAGYLYVPDGLKQGERRSSLVLCGGFGAHQERFLPEMAQYLTRHGYVAFTFDYRGFGESEGPRWRMVPQEQVRDISNAITFLGLQEEVDAGSIGLLGISFGGANVCYTAGVDPRARCTVSIVGVGCGESWLKGLRRAWEWQSFLDELAEDRTQRALTGKSRVVERLHIMVPDPSTQEMAKVAQQKYPGTCTHMPLETADAVISFHPEEVVGRISPRAVLFIVAGADVLVPNENTLELYRRAGEPKRWIVLPGKQHYEVYSPPAFDVVMAETVAWYQQHMPSASSQGMEGTGLQRSPCEKSTSW
ncbi:MAG: alpha/beta fold hydrolase [Chloroflexi bacterium]|nr:alpha/beta fold hydrolase [Chloroflexota bacterium]